MLFTHRGLSGPAMLQISNYWAHGAPIEIDLLPGDSVRDQVEQWRHSGARASWKTLLARHLTSRLVVAWLGAHAQLRALADKPGAQQRHDELEALAQSF